jgi:Skp family chaperone for outer membrane proteins
VAFAAGLAVLGALVYCGSRLVAQTPGAAPPPAAPARPLQTRIGLINMVQVLKNYKKFQNLENQLKTRAQQLDETIKPLKIQADKLKEEYSRGNITPERKEEIEREMRKLQGEAQEKEEIARKELMKMNGEAAVTVYREVEDAANSYSRANNLELVLFYNDAVTDTDYYHPSNVRQKMMQPAALMPMVVAPGMDISNAVVNFLNSKYAPPAAGASAVPPPAPPHH